jgi:hypothetical protein
MMGKAPLPSLDSIRIRKQEKKKNAFLPIDPFSLLPPIDFRLYYRFSGCARFLAYLVIQYNALLFGVEPFAGFAVAPHVGSRVVEHGCLQVKEELLVF